METWGFRLVDQESLYKLTSSLERICKKQVIFKFGIVDETFRLLISHRPSTTCKPINLWGSFDVVEIGIIPEKTSLNFAIELPLHSLNQILSTLSNSSKLRFNFDFLEKKVQISDINGDDTVSYTIDCNCIFEANLIEYYFSEPSIIAPSISLVVKPTQIDLLKRKLSIFKSSNVSVRIGANYEGNLEISLVDSSHLSVTFKMTQMQRLEADFRDSFRMFWVVLKLDLLLRVLSLSIPYDSLIWGIIPDQALLFSATQKSTDNTMTFFIPSCEE